MITQKNPFLDKFYMLVLATLPVLSQYRIGPLDLDVVLMLVFFGLYIFTTKTISITSVGVPISLLIVYILLTTGINLLIGERFSPQTDIFLRMGRYCLYLLVVFLFGNTHTNYEDFMRIYRIVAYAASIYIILQTIFYYGLGIKLPNKIGSVSVSEGLRDVGRLRSFYSEPAELGYNLAPFIACSLFGKPYKQGISIGNELDALLVSIGIVLSTSGQGIICISLIWGLWVLNRIFKHGVRVKDALLILCAIVAIVVLYTSGILEYAIGRADDTSESSAVNARTSGYLTLTLLSPLQRLFGAGFGNYVVENIYDLDFYYKVANYSSIAEFLFTLGLFGTIFWVCIFIYLYRKNTSCGKILILALLMLSLLGCPMTGKHFPLWLTLICVQLPEGLFAQKSQPTNI